MNKAVDWLYFTGKLPADPIGRLFSTVTYARQIVFLQLDVAHKAIDKITAIHLAVEENRNSKIPDWAYRDVLFMLIHYSVASYELLERKLSLAEKEDLYDVFLRMGKRMNLKELPTDYNNWLISQQAHLQADLQKTDLTVDLFKQYQKHLGGFRYWLLIESQKLVVPARIKELLGFKNSLCMKIILQFYKLSRIIKLDGLIKTIVLPAKYNAEIKALDRSI